MIANGDPGGGTTAVLTLSRLLHEAGKWVAIASQRDSYILQAAQEFGLLTFPLEFSSRRAAIGAYSALAKLFQEQRPAIVHAHGNRAGLPVSLARRLYRGKNFGRFFYTVHGFHFQAKPPGLFQLARQAEKMAIHEADCTIFVSEGDRRIANQHRLLAHPDRCSVVPNAVLAQDIPWKRHPEFDIAFLGRLTYPKNPLIIPEIIAAMAPLKPTVQVIGGGELSDALHQKVMQLGLDKQFVFQGQQDRANALALSARCKVLLFPSRWEGHPIAVIEAMHMGLPVVATRIPGTEAIVRDGETGYLVELDDVAAFAAALTRLLTNPAALATMASSGQADVAARYSPERMLTDTLSLYQ